MSTQSPHRVAKADRLQSSIYGLQVAEHRPPYIRPHRPETEPIERFSDEQFAFLVHKLLEDWDSTTLTELGLCRAHSITLEELDTITDDEDFQRALALVRRVRAKREHEREATTRAALHDRLLRLIYQNTDTTTDAKEVRLACKQLETLMQKNPGHAHDESSKRGGGVPVSTPSPAPRGAGEGPERSEDEGGNLDSPSLTLRACQDTDRSPSTPESGGVGAAAPTQQPLPDPSTLTADGGMEGARSPNNQRPRPEDRPIPNPHKPKSPRGYKSRPQAKSR